MPNQIVAIFQREAQNHERNLARLLEFGNTLAANREKERYHRWLRSSHQSQLLRFAERIENENA